MYTENTVEDSFEVCSAGNKLIECLLLHTSIMVIGYWENSTMIILRVACENFETWQVRFFHMFPCWKFTLEKKIFFPERLCFDTKFSFRAIEYQIQCFQWLVARRIFLMRKFFLREKHRTTHWFPSPPSIGYHIALPWIVPGSFAWQDVCTEHDTLEQTRDQPLK